jgi:hypothetical protein
MPSRMKLNQPFPAGSWQRLARWLKTGPSILSETRLSRRISGRLDKQAQTLSVTADTAERLRSEWVRILASPGQGSASVLLKAEQAALDHIRERTVTANRNNLTRTAAYWQVYSSCPELHWALLAHMVSRNGGWSMTDLKGELLARLLGEQECRDIFLFLERANSLIFQDAYPQLLLYTESLRLGRPMFHLLPHLHVSAFMQPVWSSFWESRDPVPLTICLIINEQHYIEGRVVRNSFYQKQVLDKPAFWMQPLMQLNQVVFPYAEVGGDAGRSPDGPSLSGNLPAFRLAGLVVENFSKLEERIGVGKALYAMLFGIPAIRRGTESFAALQPHTGSRADYNPYLFTQAKKAPPQKLYAERLDGYGLRPGAEPLYSPRLNAAWEDHPSEAVERYDWFIDIQSADALTGCTAPAALDMTGEACLGLYKLELAVLAAETAGLGKL